MVDRKARHRQALVDLPNVFLERARVYIIALQQLFQPGWRIRERLDRAAVSSRADTTVLAAHVVRLAIEQEGTAMLALLTAVTHPGPANSERRDRQDAVEHRLRMPGLL